MIKKYYFEDTTLNTKYPTLWNGYLLYNGENISISENYYQRSNRDLDDLLVDICDVNFYVTLIDNNIYLSVCGDSSFYYYNFEKTIKKAIKKIEKKFNINITESEFFATELKPMGNQYKYSTSKNDGDDKIILKKKTLNWITYENKNEKEDNIILKKKVSIKKICENKNVELDTVNQHLSEVRI
jgi:hypothetical protein